MKTLIYITLAVFSCLVVISCKDSLGYDPNVEITKIVTDTTGGKVDSSGAGKNKFMPDSVVINYFRCEVENGPWPSRDYDWPYKIAKDSVTFDTSGTYIKLYMDLEFITTMSEMQCNQRNLNELITYYKIKFSDSLDRSLFPLSKNNKSDNSIISIKKLAPFNQNIDINGNQDDQYIFFQISNKQKYIKCNISIDQFNPSLKLQLRQFFAEFLIYYH